MAFDKLDMENAELVSPDKGLKWNVPMCSKCEYCKGKNCSFYQKARLDSGVDIFNCPSFKESTYSEKNKAGDMFGVKLNGSM